MSNQSTYDVLTQVHYERTLQDEKWGEQNHPFLPPNGTDWLLRSDYLWNAEGWKVRNEYRQASGQLAWEGILLEEVFEALSEEDPVKREQELIQVAAVAVAIVESSRRARGQ